MKFDALVEMADKVMMYKYIVKNVAKKYGKTVTFMPKPLFGDNGSGMHVHISLWKGGAAAVRRLAATPACATWPCTPSAACSSTPRPCAPSANPTTNSYKRLVPGYEAPVNLAYSQRNRSASIRIPMYSPNPKAKRLEFRCPDPSCNPYLVLLRHADGGARRHQEQDRSGRAARQGHLRPGAGRTGEGAAGARLAGRSAGRPGDGPRVPAARRRLHAAT